jgi:hypothetical protein
MDTLEKIVSDTILQKSSDVIVIDDVEYPITPPTPGTLIMVSEFISQMPIINKNAENVLIEVLGKAKDMALIGKIAATLILGAKRIKERRYVYGKNRWFGVAKRTLEIDYLSERILDEVTNETLVNLVSKRLGKMQIGDFFQLTASLSEANLLKRTKEAETASGE